VARRVSFWLPASILSAPVTLPEGSLQDGMAVSEHTDEEYELEESEDIIENAEEEDGDGGGPLFPIAGFLADQEDWNHASKVADSTFLQHYSFCDEIMVDFRVIASIDASDIWNIVYSEFAQKHAQGNRRKHWAMTWQQVKSRLRQYFQ
jgi:hypothetical protein